MNSMTMNMIMIRSYSYIIFTQLGWDWEGRQKNSLALAGADARFVICYLLLMELKLQPQNLLKPQTSMSIYTEMEFEGDWSKDAHFLYRYRE
jgi:hypothetical protein